MFNHETARTRKKLSAPMDWLKKQGLLVYGSGHLDYGCGKGFDADYLNCKKFDPYFSPDMPEGQFKVITCLYVLNVIPTKEGRDRVISDIRRRLTDNGRAYIAVRRDLHKYDKMPARQSDVILDETSIRLYKSHYELYLIKKEK